MFSSSLSEGALSCVLGSQYMLLCLWEGTDLGVLVENLLLCASKRQIFLESGILIKSKYVIQI